MFRKIVLLAIFVALPSVALADRITIINNSSNSIYKLFAWPQNLMPRTFNILGAPLFPGSQTDISVDNEFGDCMFNFQYDPNNPMRSKKRGYRKLGFGMTTFNMCGKNKTVSLP